jgi:hypothetical protein
MDLHEPGKDRHQCEGADIAKDKGTDGKIQGRPESNH